MKTELGNIGVIYPNEESAQTRKFQIRTDGDILHFDFIDPKIDTGGFYLEKDQVKLLVDTLNVILKNKLME
ncbi:hypothetical protein [Aurantibacter aestuarii]|uniref:Uncharacterized protein n=1 Tax=Aurantibacter aestuarii TaxID=1266046 RepID=A0A2T1N6X0_9FLAO|nr:hypothetical protein [Aurantibacter aestuarii]PSG87313.1 hypothetical protein C7H52_11205 [Aurantibacter aestuarii]